MRLSLARRRPRAPRPAALVGGALAALFASALPAAAQTDPGAFRAFPAFREVTAVAASADAVWAGTRSGIFAVTADGAFERYTPVDGLAGGDLLSLAVDDAGVVWAGYADGALDRIDPATGDIQTVFDIARATQYAARGINRIRPVGAALYLATEFGLVVYDTARRQVRTTAARLGPVEAGAPVYDVAFAPRPGGGEGLWLATAEGLVYADAASTELQIPSAWTRDAAWTGEARAVLNVDGTVWGGGAPTPGDQRAVYARTPEGAYRQLVFIDDEIAELIRTPEGRVAVISRERGSVRVLAPDGALWRQVTEPEAARIQAAAVGPDGALWVGDLVAGLFPLPALGAAPATTTVDPDPRVPAGPYANQIVGLDVDGEGTVWVSTETVAQVAAVSRLPVAGTWVTRTNADPELPQDGFTSVSARPGGGAIVGSSGSGVAVFDPDGSATTFDQSNSTLQIAIGSRPSDNFVVVSDAEEDGGLWWVLNKGASAPLHVFPGTREATAADWTALPRPSGFPNSGSPDRLAIDGFGQKWMTLGTRGLYVWDTGADPRDPSDDRGRLYSGNGSNGQGLPDAEVADVVVDLQGRVWIGTKRGLGVVFSPGSAFGDPGLAVPQWPRTEAGDSFFLRDVEVNDLDVDPAGRLWVATETGAYLVSPAGDAVEVLLDTSSSPLPSDNVRAVAVDDRTGTVYLATDIGLYAYQGDSTGPDPTAESLRVGPNPFRPGQHAGVTISGLGSSVNGVRVLTLDGRAVFESDEVFGGSFRWDGRDARTGEAVPSGVYIVAAVGGEGVGVRYGKVAVIR